MQISNFLIRRVVIRGEGKRHYRSSRLNRVDKYLSRAFENLPRFQNTRLGGANSHDPRKSSLFDTHLETHESWRNLEVNGFKKQSFAREPLLERSPFIKEGGGTELSPATVQLLSRPHAGTFHASLRGVSSDLAFISTLFSSPIYIYIYIFRLFHPSSLFDHYASLTSEQVRPSTVVEAAESKVTTFLSLFRARNKNTSASRK